MGRGGLVFFLAFFLGEGRFGFFLGVLGGERGKGGEGLGVLVGEGRGGSQNDTNRNPHLGWAMATIPREDPPRERRKNEISGGREKKARNFVPRTLRAPTPSASHHPTLPPPNPPTAQPAHQPPKNNWQQKLAKFGQIRLAK